MAEVNIPKQRFADAVQKDIQLIAELDDSLSALAKEYIGLHYNNTDPISADDLGAVAHYTPEQLAAGIDLAGDFLALMNLGENRNIANALRRSGGGRAV